ncbi:MAG: hypothetical protein IKD80_00115, partial [Selenomonadaceae bacterium]|nr:hypothetical protein [Selenomonadaceae bacterium]
YHGNKGAVGSGSDTDNTRLYTFTATSGVTAEYTGDNDQKVTFDGKDYYASGATFKLTVDANNFPQYYKIRSVSGATANADGTYTATINGDLTVQVDGYPKIAELAFDSDTNKYTVANTADFLILASYVSGGGDISGLEFNFTATEYTINDLNELRALADYVNAGGDTSGKTFKLTANISGVDFTIGDSDAHKFKGTFDGDDKTISVNIEDNTQQGTALFRYIEGATIQKLTVDGTATGTTHAAGLVGFCDGTNTVKDVTVNVAVKNPATSGNTHIGGVVGHALSSTLNMTNVIFGGTLENAGSAKGGLVGWSDSATITMTDCLSTGSYTGANSAAFNPVIGGSKNATLNNVYYTNDPTDSNAKGTKVYESLTLPEGVEATATDENTVKFGNTTYYVSGASITLKVTEQPDGKFLKGATRNDDGTYTYTIGNTAEWTDIPTIGGLTFDNTIGAYKIATLADLQTLATYISNDGDTADLTFKLTADISDVDFVIGTFKGTLDGNGHKITLNHTASIADCALFSELNNATIKNLHVDGTINTSNKYAAGFAITTKGTTTITDCRSSVEINGTASGYAYYGGFVRIVDSGTLNVTNCIFDGKFSSTNPTKAVCIGIGQIASGTTLNLSNCLVAPQAVIENPNSWSSTFYVVNGSTGSGGDNNYYTQVIKSVIGGKQVYAVTLPEGVAASGAVFVVDNTAYAPAGAQLTFAGKTGYIFSGDKSLTVTEAVTVTGTVTFDTENHYVLADDTTKLATTTNTTDYPELIQVYELTLSEGVTVNGGIHAVDNGVTYAAGNVTFDAGTGAAVKPVTVNTDTNISAADIYYTVTLPDALEIVNNSLNDGDTYTVNGTTYYKRGATLTLRLKDNYTAA